MVDMISPVVGQGEKTRRVRGFSVDEISAAGLSVREARHIGVPVDQRRKTSHSENIEKLKSWTEEAKKREFRIPRPKQSSKGQKGRAYRGKTSSGKKMRSLRKS
jgi:large subunit ribosomal protein L13e